MKWMSQEEIAALRQIDLLSFLRQKETGRTDTNFGYRVYDSYP